MTATLFVDCETHCEHEPPRDRWGRPAIPGMGTLVRASKLSKAPDDMSNLIDWAGGMVAVGMAMEGSADLREAAILARGDNKALKSVQRTAKERASSGAAAQRGTNLHEAVSRSVRGMDVSDLPAAMKTSLEAFNDATQ